MALEPGADVDQLGKAGGVALGKAVFAKADDLAEDGFSVLGRVALGLHALHQQVVKLVHAAAALPGGHGAAQGVGLVGAEIGRQHGDLHHLLLEDGHAQRTRQRRRQGGGKVDRLQPLATAQVGVDHAALDWPGANDGDLDHQVIKATRAQARQHAHLGPALDLEHAHGVGGADHVVGGGVIGRDVLQAQKPAAPLPDQRKAAADGAEHAQRQHIDLEQAHGVEVVLVPLDDAALGHGGVFYRHQAGELALCQHKTTHMLAQVARKPQQLGHQTAPQGQLPVQRIEPSLGKFLVLDTAAVKPVVRLGQLVDQYLVHTQRPANVTQGAARPVADHRGGEGGALAAVAGVDVLDDFLAPLVLKVDVDVGRLVARAADEALKQQAGVRRVDLGHAQAVAHRRIGGRAPALAQNALAPGKAHDVVHRQKIHLVAQLGNQRQLVRHLLRHARRQALRVAPSRTFVGVVVQGLARAQARQHALHRVLVAQLVQAELAACCHQQGIGQQHGRIKLRQPLTGAQVRLGIGLQGKTTLGHRPAQTDGGEHIVQRLA